MNAIAHEIDHNKLFNNINLKKKTKRIDKINVPTVQYTPLNTCKTPYKIIFNVSIMNVI